MASFINDYIWTPLLKQVVSWLTGIDEDDFGKITLWVQEAESKFLSGTGAEKAAWVKEQIINTLKVAVPFLLNVLVEIAVAYAKKQGMIAS